MHVINRKVMNKRIVIKRITHGKFKGQFRFVLKAANNEVIATSEQYVAKQSITGLAKEHFPDFELDDKTLKK